MEFRLFNIDDINHTRIIKFLHDFYIDDSYEIKKVGMPSSNEYIIKFVPSIDISSLSKYFKSKRYDFTLKENKMKLSLKERKLVREYAKKLIESNSDNITADELVKKISTETEIKVNFTGAWDLLDSIKGAKVITINRGKGFEEAIKVTSNHGDFLYMPPFKMEAEATDTTLLLFYADDAIFIKS